MKTHNRHQRGLTIDEIRLQRAITTCKIAIETHKLSNLMPGIFKKNDNAAPQIPLKPNYIRTALTYADLVVNIITILKKISQIYTRIKK